MSHHDNETLKELLGPILLTKVGKFQEKANLRNFKNSFFHHGPSQDTTQALQGKDFVLLYFSAAWCPPCQKFTPLLKDFYKTCHDNTTNDSIQDDLEVVYVSSDRDLAEFEEYYGKMPWLALESQKHKTSLSQKCHVSGIPALVVLDGHGRFVTDGARRDVATAGGDPALVKKVLELWKATKAVPLDEAEFSNSGMVCRIL